MVGRTTDSDKRCQTMALNDHECDNQPGGDSAEQAEGAVRPRPGLRAVSGPLIIAEWCRGAMKCRAPRRASSGEEGEYLVGEP